VIEEEYARLKGKMGVRNQEGKEPRLVPWLLDVK
jgi:hypothetical protein